MNHEQTRRRRTRIRSAGSGRPRPPLNSATSTVVCNGFQIGKWAACVEDCEALLRENPENKEIARIMKETEVQLRKGGTAQELKGAGRDAAGLLVEASSEHFRDFVASSGSTMS